MIWLGENMNWLSYIELAREVNRLGATIEALGDLLAEKKVTTKFDIDCVFEKAALKADEDFEKTIRDIDYEEEENGKFNSD